MSIQRKMIVPTGSDLLTEKFINSLMKDGKKTTARTVFKDTLQILSKQGQKYPEKVFSKAVDMVKPQIEVRPKRIGGAVYQIPVEVKPNRQLTLAIRWIIQAARAKKGKSMAERLADEFVQANQEQGAAYKKKMDVFRMAQANKAFAHFARY